MAPGGVIMRGRHLFAMLLLSSLALSCDGGGPDLTAVDEEVHGGPGAGHDEFEDQIPGVHVRRVLLISVDGLHEVDLTRFIADHADSTLAGLAQHGLQFDNAWVNRLDGSPTNPSDSFPGLLALTTGGSSPTTGGWYDVSYARDLFPDDTCATAGTMVAYDEGAELDNSSLWGAAGAGPTHDPVVVRSRLDPNKLPFRKSAGGCTPVFPHSYIRVNTIFEVAHAAGMH